MTINLYYHNSSPPCRAVLMTAKHLNIDVNIQNIDLSKGQHKSSDYLKLNPNHKVPTLVDNGFILWESRAIMQYLCNQYAPDSTLYPTDPKQRALVHRWLYLDMTFIAANSSVLLLKVKYGKEPNEQQVTTFKNTVKLVDTLIGDNHYVAGGQHVTIADLSLLATTTLLCINDYQDFNDCPNLKQWFSQLQIELPYFDEINGKVGDEFKKWIRN